MIVSRFARQILEQEGRKNGDERWNVWLRERERVPDCRRASVAVTQMTVVSSRSVLAGFPWNQESATRVVSAPAGNSGGLAAVPGCVTTQVFSCEALRDVAGARWLRSFVAGSETNFLCGERRLPKRHHRTV